MKCKKCPLLVVVCGFLFLGIAHGSEDLLNVTHTVTLEVMLRHEYTGRIQIGLFGKAVPRTVKKFIQLAVKPKGEGYVGTRFHRIIKGEGIQGGMFGQEKNVTSDDWDYFADENLKIQHHGSGWVTMANTGNDTHSGRFHIASNRHVKYRNGEHVVFGKVLKGMEVVHEIEELGIGDNHEALVDAEIFGCIVEPLFEPYIETPDHAEEFIY